MQWTNGLEKIIKNNLFFNLKRFTFNLKRFIMILTTTDQLKIKTIGGMEDENS